MSVFGVFWSVFSHIRTEYGEILRFSLYSVRMREIADQKNSEYRHLSRSVSHLWMRLKILLELLPHMRSSQHRYSVRKRVLKNFAKFTGKHLCQGLFDNKVEGLFYITPLGYCFCKFLKTIG